MKPYFTLSKYLIVMFLMTITCASYAQNHFSKSKKRTKEKEGTHQKSFHFEEKSGKNILSNNKTSPIFQKPLLLNGLVENRSKNTTQKVELLNIKRSSEGLPIFIEGVPQNYAQRIGEPLNDKTQCLTYLEGIQDLMNIKNAKEEFSFSNAQVDELGHQHFKWTQTYKGVKVYGSEVVMHKKDGKIDAFNGNYFPTPSLKDVSPSLSKEKAFEFAQNHVKTITQFVELSEKEKALIHKQLHKGHSDEEYIYEPELYVYHLQRNENQEFLVYHVTVRPNFIERYEYFIEANTGEVIDYYNHTCYLTPRTATATDLNNKSRTINTTEDGGTFYLFDSSRPMFKTKSDGDFEGAIITYDLKNTQLSNPKYEIITSSNNTWNNKTSVSAHYNAGVAYEYFKNIHNRNSINGQGGNIVSFINVPDEDGGGLDNAFWNGEFIFYGNGKQAFKPLAGALDVAGHEMTHGVVQNTANLEYRGQSGAINESMADIFGAMMDREDWKLGEDVTSTQFFPTGALRDLSNPHNGGNSLNDNGYQPRHTNEMYNGSEDNGGVHINSGIPNFAFFKLATATSKEKAEKIFYRALSQYLTRSSQFLDLRLAVVKATSDLHGASSAEVNAAKKAFDEVGIVDGTSTSEPEDIEVNPGTDFILSYDVSTTDENTLYVSGTDGKNFVPKTKTLLNNKPSVSDDGVDVVFIDENKKMRSLSLTGSTNETIISQDLWDNVAISKDGRRLAAITTEIDKAIWVYDFEKKKWTKFTLYNPTFTEGISTEEVLYADALEWDYTGEYLLYDAYNEIEDFTGDKLSYWDVGIIKVWDNEANNFDEGEIFKIFSDLPEGWSIGDPTFSKNSPYIIAFDYFNEDEDEYWVMTANLETGDFGEIFQNTILGYPNYSKLDNKLIFNALATDDSEIIAVNNLKTDKISPNGSPTALIPDAKWGVWYTQGQRQTNPTGTEDELAQLNLKVYPNPTTLFTKIELEMRVGEELSISVFDLQGKMRKESVQKATQTGMNQFNLSLEGLPTGMYVIRMRIGDKTSSRKIVKE